uniref:SEC22 homolog A, vesicle trafficking protein n=1 Tax=Petromyzon marinus TaxID=7757 RepID=S4RPV8_PETMA
MSSVLFASVVRVRDGLPLSASTDQQPTAALQASKRSLKLLSRRLSALPDRCSLGAAPSQRIHFISALGVAYLLVCEDAYPAVLAFSFLDELQREFLSTYERARIETAVRPYCLIEFDTFIQKTKQRYNSPRSLSVRLNLTELQTELRLRPPHQLSERDFANGGVSTSAEPVHTSLCMSPPRSHLGPVSVTGAISLLLNFVCGLLNLVRGFHLLENTLMEDGEGSFNIMVFFLACSTSFYQCSLLVRQCHWRKAKALASLAVVCACNARLADTRTAWQLLFHVGASIMGAAQVCAWQPAGKSADYNV